MKPHWATTIVPVNSRAGVGVTEIFPRSIAGTPIMFFHGWGVNPQTYRASLELLADDGYAIYAPHLAGFGLSTPLVGAQASNLTEYATRFADVWSAAQFPRPAQIVAHSMGCGVAVKLAIVRPDLVESLILVCPIGGGGEKVPWPKLAASFMKELHIDWATETFNVIPGMLRHFGSAARSAMVARTADLAADLAYLAPRIPITVIYAKDDGVVHPGPLLRVPHIDLVKVDGGHGWLIQHPALFAANVEPILQTADRGASA